MAYSKIDESLEELISTTYCYLTSLTAFKRHVKHGKISKIAQKQKEISDNLLTANRLLQGQINLLDSLFITKDDITRVSITIIPPISETKNFKSKPNRTPTISKRAKKPIIPESKIVNDDKKTFKTIQKDAAKV